MQTTLLIILIIGLVVVIYLLLQNKKPSEDKSLLLLQSQISDLTKQLHEKIDSTTHQSAKMLQDQFIETSRISKDMTEKLLKLEETNKQVVGFTDQLQNLEKVLTNAKTRGNLGEASLEMILSNILPPQSYEMQYSLGKDKDGKEMRPDAVIKLKDKILPVDAKFPLENYRRIINSKNEEERKQLEQIFKRDLKDRINETARYIQPNKGTLDYAFMFIPAEGIFYDLLVADVGAVKIDTGGLINYAFNEKKVIIVSPTTFSAYLQTVLYGLRALQIEETAKDIKKNMENWQRHMAVYIDHHRRLGNQLSTIANTYDNSSKSLKLLHKDALKVTGSGGEIDIEEIERPRLE